MQTRFKETEIGKVPEDWEVCVFSQAVAVNPLRKLKKSVTAKKVSMQNLQKFRRKIAGYEIAKFNGGTKFRNNDTLMARITPCLENGKTSYVDILDNGEVGFGSTEFNVFCGKDGKTTDRFAYYLAISPSVRAEAINSMVGTSGRQRVQSDIFDSILIPIPSIIEQEAIAKVFSDLDSKIELNNQMNKTLEAIGQALFKRWFVDFEFPNEKGKPYKSDGGVMVDSELGEIPKGWEVKKTKEIVAKLGPGTNYQPMRVKAGIPFLNIRNISSGFLLLNDVKYISKEDYKWVHKSWEPEEHDILITRIGTLGNVAIIRKKDLPISVHYNMIDIKPKDTSYAFIYFLLKSDYFQQQYHLKKKQTVQEYITIFEVENISLALPPKVILEKLENVFLQLAKFLENNFTQNETLSQIRDSLLPRLMSGKIRVGGF